MVFSSWLITGYSLKTICLNVNFFPIFGGQNKAVCHILSRKAGGKKEEIFYRQKTPLGWIIHPERG